MIQKVGPYFEKLAPPFDWKDNLQELHAHVLSYLLWRRSTFFNQEGGLQKSRLNDMFFNSCVGSSLDHKHEVFKKEVGTSSFQNMMRNNMSAQKKERKERKEDVATNWD